MVTLTRSTWCLFCEELNPPPLPLSPPHMAIAIPPPSLPHIAPQFPLTLKQFLLNIPQIPPFYFPSIPFFHWRAFPFLTPSLSLSLCLASARRLLWKNENVKMEALCVWASISVVQISPWHFFLPSSFPFFTSLHFCLMRYILVYDIWRVLGWCREWVRLRRF